MIAGHVFVDGNKRTAVVAAIYLLTAQDALDAPPTPLQVRLFGELAVEVASASMSVDDVANWIGRLVAPKS